MYARPRRIGLHKPARLPATLTALPVIGRMREPHWPAAQSQEEQQRNCASISRMWRRDVAKKQGIPAFTVMHDTSLERAMPVADAAIAGTPFVGSTALASARPSPMDVKFWKRSMPIPAGAPVLIKQQREKATSPPGSLQKLVIEGKTLEEIARSYADANSASVVELSCLHGGRRRDGFPLGLESKPKNMLRLQKPAPSCWHGAP